MLCWFWESGGYFSWVVVLLSSLPLRLSLMYIITSCSSFLRNCQSIPTSASASGKDKPWYLSLLWIVRTEELFRNSSAWDTLLWTNAEGVSWCMEVAAPCSMGSAYSWQPQFSNCVIHLELHHLCSLVSQAPVLDPLMLTSEERTSSSSGRSWNLANLYWTVKGLIHLILLFLELLELPKHFQSRVTRISFLWSREQIVCCHIFPQKVLAISWCGIIGVSVLTVLRLLNSLVVTPFQQLHGCT